MNTSSSPTIVHRLVHVGADKDSVDARNNRIACVGVQSDGLSMEGACCGGERWIAVLPKVLLQARPTSESRKSQQGWHRGNQKHACKFGRPSASQSRPRNFHPHNLGSASTERKRIKDERKTTVRRSSSRFFSDTTVKDRVPRSNCSTSSLATTSPTPEPQVPGISDGMRCQNR